MERGGSRTSIAEEDRAEINKVLLASLPGCTAASMDDNAPVYVAVTIQPTGKAAKVSLCCAFSFARALVGVHSNRSHDFGCLHHRTNRVVVAQCTPSPACGKQDLFVHTTFRHSQILYVYVFNITYPAINNTA